MKRVKIITDSCADLTAEQAAHLYEKSDVRVIESATIGAGYAFLAMSFIQANI